MPNQPILTTEAHAREYERMAKVLKRLNAFVSFHRDMVQEDRNWRRFKDADLREALVNELEMIEPA